MRAGALTRRAGPSQGLAETLGLAGGAADTLAGPPRAGGRAPSELVALARRPAQGLAQRCGR